MSGCIDSLEKFPVVKHINIHVWSMFSSGKHIKEYGEKKTCKRLRRQWQESQGQRSWSNNDLYGVAQAQLTV